MITRPSVLLPEPFGPMSACVSPRRITRFTPWRIGLPSTPACRFSIFSVSVVIGHWPLAIGHWSFDLGQRFHRSSCYLLVIVNGFAVLDGRFDIAAVVWNRQLVFHLLSQSAGGGHPVAHPFPRPG